MSRLPGHIGQAFLMAAGELGMFSAARLFVGELARLGGDELIAELCDVFGREYPVLDFVAHRWLEGDRTRALDAIEVQRALDGIKRLVVVGLETEALDALVAAFPGVEMGLVAEPLVCAGSSLFLTAATSGPLAQALTERADLRDSEGQTLRFGFVEFLPTGLLGFAVIEAVALGYAAWVLA